MSGLRNFDAWLTTDRLAEEAERRAEVEFAAWEDHCEREELDVEMSDPDHPEHEVYQEWSTAWERSLDEYE